jgi:ligand-binding sensor domain-containing protein
LWSQSSYAFQRDKGTPFISNISYQAGLKTQTIFDIFIDQKGLLFLGTDQGLMSYNGTFIKTYPFRSSLSSSIDQLQQDEEGTIWCKNFSDQIFYFKNDSLIPRYNVNRFLEKNRENLTDFLISEDRIYFISEKNLYYEDKDGHIDLLYTCKNDNILFKLYKDRTTNRIFLLSHTNVKEIKNTRLTDFRETVRGQKDMVIASESLFYFLKGNENKLYKEDKEINVNTSANQYFYNLIKTDSLLWLCTSNGLIEINPKEGRVKNKILTGYRINDVAKDLEGNYWISSIDDGLFFMPNKDMKVLKFEDEKLSQNFTTIIADSLGNIFAGTTKGEIIQLDKDYNLQFVYKTETAIEISYIFPYKNYIISSSGVFKRNESSAFINEYFGKDISIDAFGNFVIATYNSAGLISSEFKGKPKPSKELENLFSVLDFSTLSKFYAFRNKRARSVHYSKIHNAYYIGFSDGLYKYNLNGNIEEIKTASGMSIVAKSITEDKQGHIWLATYQQGLVLISLDSDIRIFDTQLGLSSNNCKEVYADDNGVWVLTNESLDFISLEDFRIKNIGYDLGLKKAVVNTFTIDKHNIWLATKNGLIYFPKENTIPTTEPYLDIIARTNNGSKLDNMAILPYDNNNLLVTLNSIVYKGAENYKYEYILEPFHKEWQTQDARQNQLNFVSLSPNSYSLKVRINNGSYVSAEKVFRFSVLKPFWAEQWFMVLSFISLCLVIFGVYTAAVNRTKKVQTVKEKLAISQLTALRSQMNPHFMFNILNAVQGFIYSNQKNKANTFIGNFSTLMRKILDVSGKREISIQEELDTIKLYISLEKARFEDEDFHYNFTVPEIDLSEYTIPTLIIQPFVENAIKHGLMHKSGQKKLDIRLEGYDENYWKFCIEDNGIGRKKSQEINQKIKNKHKPFAINAIYERIELVNKLNKLPLKIEIEDLTTALQHPVGTRVSLYIPITHENTNS